MKQLEGNQIMKQRSNRPVWYLAGSFLAVVILANLALETWGVVPIGFGLSAPAGVFFAGLAFGLRDALHERKPRMIVPAIIAGAGISWWMSDAVAIPGGVTSIAVASGVAFCVSELADMAIYSPLRERNWPAAVAASNVVGSVADSALFLWLAFGSLEFIEGQIVGKCVMVIPSLLLVRWWRYR